MGNIIIDLDYDMMVSVLRVPNEKFKDKMAKSMRDWVTTLRRELGEAPSAEEVKKTYIAAFQDLFGVELMRQGPTETEWQIFREEVKPRHTSQEWLNMETPPASLREGRMVKIAGDVILGDFYLFSPENDATLIILYNFISVLVKDHQDFREYSPVCYNNQSGIG